MTTRGGGAQSSGPWGRARRSGRSGSAQRRTPTVGDRVRVARARDRSLSEIAHGSLPRAPGVGSGGVGHPEGGEHRALERRGQSGPAPRLERVRGPVPSATGRPGALRLRPRRYLHHQNPRAGCSASRASTVPAPDRGAQHGPRPAHPTYHQRFTAPGPRWTGVYGHFGSTHEAAPCPATNWPHPAGAGGTSSTPPQGRGQRRPRRTRGRGPAHHPRCSPTPASPSSTSQVPLVGARPFPSASHSAENLRGTIATSPPRIEG